MERMEGGCSPACLSSETELGTGARGLVFLEDGMFAGQRAQLKERPLKKNYGFNWLGVGV